MSLPIWLDAWVRKPLSVEAQSQQRQWAQLVALLGEVVKDVRDQPRFRGLSVTKAMATVYQPSIPRYTVDYSGHGRADAEILATANKDGTVSRH